MQGGSVLVVEDDGFTRFAVGDHLRDCGYEVLEAETGREAIDLLANGAAVDVVFTDVQMPGDIDALGSFDGFANIGPSFPFWSPRAMPWRWSWPPSFATSNQPSPSPITKPMSPRRWRNCSTARL